MSAVLIVEDEQHLADGLRFNLEAEGYTVETVGAGEAALSLLVERREHFDAVVLDVMLPGGRLHRRSSCGRPAVRPVLMLTAPPPEDVLRGLSRAPRYLPKPFERAS